MGLRLVLRSLKTWSLLQSPNGKATPDKKVKYARKIVEQANLAESSHSTGQETQIVTLRDAEIQTDDVEAEPVVEDVEWVSNQLDLPDVDSDPDSDYGSDADSDFE